MPSNLTDRVRTAIRIELARKDLTQAALAEELGWSPMSLSKRLRGITPITTEHLQQLADALEVPVEDLIGSGVQP